MNKLKKIRQVINFYKLDGYIVPKNDEFFGEYTHASKDRLKFISSFSGSAGIGLIMQNQAFILVDGRYTLQAKRECNSFQRCSMFYDPKDEGKNYTWCFDATATIKTSRAGSQLYTKNNKGEYLIIRYYVYTRCHF